MGGSAFLWYSLPDETQTNGRVAVILYSQVMLQHSEGQAGQIADLGMGNGTMHRLAMLERTFLECDDFKHCHSPDLSY